MRVDLENIAPADIERRSMEIISEELASRGHDRELVETIHLPIGEEILAETPAEIAVSIAAQMIKIRALSRKEAR